MRQASLWGRPLARTVRILVRIGIWYCITLLSTVAFLSTVDPALLPSLEMPVWRTSAEIIPTIWARWQLCFPIDHVARLLYGGIGTLLICNEWTSYLWSHVFQGE